MPTDLEARFAGWLREARRVMAFCGAGISAESGLPTFRGGGGLWEGHQVEDVATPAAFRRDPQMVWRFYAMRQEALGQVEPNPAHFALARLEQGCDDFLLVTQNVDNLHERAGSRKMVKIHGSLMETRCVRCEQVETLAAPVSRADIDQGDLPHCQCGGLLRPNVVWFGEYLNPEHLDRIYAFFDRIPRASTRDSSNLLLVIGTSGAVSGGYGITSLAREAGARVVEINPEPSYLSHEADMVLPVPAGELFSRVYEPG